MVSSAIAKALLASALLTCCRATTISVFNLTQNYSGPTFFDRWNYFANYDNLTLGNVTYIPAPSSTVSSDSSTNLTYINSLGNAIIKVDNSTRLNDGQRRNSVRITSQDSYEAGTMWILDAVHVPYGCSVWPAFWSWGANWPQGGEIDMVEGVNNQVGNRVAMHSEAGCSIAPSNSSYSGLAENLDCSYSLNNNSGCSFSDQDPNSYGPGFAQAGGGIWATLFSSSNILTWFFPRQNIPSIFSNSSFIVNSTSLGIPVAALTSQSCEISKYFAAQSLIFDITLCGDWAGTADTIAITGCDSLQSGLSCYSTYVREPANYDQAYFEIRSLRVYNLTSQFTSAASLSRRSVRGSIWVIFALTVFASLFFATQ